MQGIKTGGRTKGTPNKRTAELAERLESMGADPLAALVAVAADDETPLEIKVAINKELLGFIYPRRKAVDVTHEGPPVVIQFGAEDALL